MDYDLTPRKPPKHRQGFSNKSMRIVSSNKPHIVFIEGFWRVSQLKKPSKALRQRWYDAHAFATRLNNNIHVWPFIKPVPGELYK